MEVVWHPKAIAELQELPPRERAAMLHVNEKLQALGEQLPFPHSSAVKGSPGLRELRPRRGSSPWRAFYARVRDTLVIAAIGPEANVNPRTFAQARARAEQRIAELKEER